MHLKIETTISYAELTHLVILTVWTLQTPRLNITMETMALKLIQILTVKKKK